MGFGDYCFRITSYNVCYTKLLRESFSSFALPIHETSFSSTPPEVEPSPSFSLASFEDSIEKIIKKYFKFEMQVMLKNLLVDTMKEMEIVKKENLIFSGQISHIRNNFV